MATRPRRPNQTYAPNGLLYDPITARGQYNNAVVNNGGLLSNAQAAGLHSQSGYMPNRTVGGKYGMPMPSDYSMANADSVNYQDAARTQYGLPTSAGQGGINNEDFLGGNQPWFGGAAVRPVGGRPTFVDATPNTYDYRSQAAGLLGPGGQVTPAYLEAIRAARPVQSPGMAGGGGYDPFAGGSQGGSPYAPTPRNAGGLSPLEARESSRQSALADAKSGNPQTARGMVTARAIQRQQDRRGRIASRNAPQQGMGLLEQMAMRDPRNAAQLLEIQRRGLLGQQELELKRQQGLLDAEVKREGYGIEGKRYEAEIARQGNIDSRDSQKLALDYEAAATEAEARGDFPAADRYRGLAAGMTGQGQAGAQQATPRRVAAPKPPPGASPHMTQTQWNRYTTLDENKKAQYLRSIGVDRQGQRAIQKAEAGPNLWDAYSAGNQAIGGLLGDAISPAINGLFDDPAMPRQPNAGELDDQPDDSPQMRALKARLRQRYSVGRSSQSRPVSF
jgi:hypothetical protein